MVNLFLVDDHPLILEGFKNMLQDSPGLNIIGSADNATEALNWLHSFPSPDLVLLDLNLKDIDGITLCQQLRNEFSAMKIIIITSTNDGPIVIKALRSGANGYMLKSSGLNELALAIKRVMQGETYICKEANAAMIIALQSESIVPNKIGSLTRREKEILHLLDKGSTSQQIAEELSLSVYTIDTHRKNMLQKFNVHNTHGLLHFVSQHNLLF